VLEEKSILSIILLEQSLNIIAMRTLLTMLRLIRLGIVLKGEHVVFMRKIATSAYPEALKHSAERYWQL
jgi:hypothetical protein